MLWAMPNVVWGAGNVRKSAPAAALKYLKGGQAMKANKKNWYDYFWIWAILYFALGFFNILFAWLGMIDFLLPLLVAVIGGNKWFCNNLCGRGQLFSLLGGKLGWSYGKPTPTFLISPWFFDFLFNHVRQCVIANVSGFCRCAFTQANGEFGMDGTFALGLGVHSRASP